MRELILVSLLAVVIIAGCTGPSCPQCPDTGVWSKCDSNGEKLRTTYTCSASTNYTCQTSEERGICKTQLELNDRDLVATASPVKDIYLSGTVKISITGVPAEGDKLWVMLAPQGLTSIEDPNQTKNLLLQVVDSKAQDVFLDTTKVENGVYNLAVTVAPAEPPASGMPWINVAQAQVVVEN